MKKVCFFLVLVIVLIGTVLAGNTIKVLRIYSDGNSTTIPLANIDSINHSKYDADGVLNAEYTTSVTWAIDSIYKIPINTIDSAIVAYLDVDEYKAKVNNILEHISEQGEMGVSQFQTELMSWLKSQEGVEEVSINVERNQISIIFNSGLELFIDFQDASFFDDSPSNAKDEILRKNIKNNSDYNVAFEQGEQIIENTNVLYIEGRAFYGTLFHDYVISEYKQLTNICDESPVNIIMPHDYYCSLKFLEEDASKFGLTIISQTHGYPDGSFQVEDEDTSCFFNRIIVYYKRATIITIGDDPWINQLNYRKVTPYQFASKLGHGPKQIVYGNYCYSYNLSTHDNNCILYGNKTPSCHAYNVDYLKQFVSKMVNGDVYYNSINLTPYTFKHNLSEIIKTVPDTNKYSKLRYFSIFTDDIDQKSKNGNPIITGKIKGFTNLKKDILPVVYVHEGGGDFTPKSVDVKKLTGDFVDEEGNFNCEYTGELKSDKEYGFVIGFEYGENVYYGEVKHFMKEGSPLCPDNNHPHVIDLGLPSGAKWFCCNVGASSPESFGESLSWNGAYRKITEKMIIPSSEQADELLNNCTFEWSVRNGKEGCIALGPNGNRLFFPLIINDSVNGNYWLLKTDPSNAGRAYCLDFTNGEMPNRDYSDKKQMIFVRMVASQLVSDSNPVFRNLEATDVSANEATLSGYLYISEDMRKEYAEMIDNIELGFVYGTNEENSVVKMHWAKVARLSELNNGLVSVKISALEADKNYHYSIITKNVGEEFSKYDVLEDESFFVTDCNCWIESDVSFVDEYDPDDSFGALVSVTNAQLNAHVQDGFCKKHHKKSGFYVNTTGNPNAQNSFFVEDEKCGLDGKNEKFGGTDRILSVMLDNLNKGTRYYFKPVCFVDDKEYIGVEYSFVTPDVETPDASKLSYNMVEMYAKHIHEPGIGNRYIRDSTYGSYLFYNNVRKHKGNKVFYLYCIGIEWYWIDEQTQEKKEYESWGTMGHYKGCRDTFWNSYPDVFDWADNVQSYFYVDENNIKTSNITLHYKAYLIDCFDKNRTYGKQKSLPLSE